MLVHKIDLTTAQLAEVETWLTRHNINLTKMRREYSDVLPIAKVLKEYYPKVIELNNFPKKNSVQMKIINWDTFNTKVLKKLGFMLTKDLLIQLANGQREAMEVLIYEIIKVERKTRRAEERAEQQNEDVLWTEHDVEKTVTVNRQIGDAIVKIPQKMVLYSSYEDALRESRCKDAVMNDYKLKIENLENLLKSKDRRIEKLQAQMTKQFAAAHLLPLPSGEPISTSESVMINVEAPTPPPSVNPQDFYESEEFNTKM